MSATLKVKPRGKRMLKHTTMRLPPKLMEQLSVIAFREGFSRSVLVEQVLREYVRKTAQERHSVFE